MKSVYSVSQVNSYIKNMFTQDFVLNSIYIKGEVSNCKYHTSGHIYFSLKDKGGVISGVMFAGNRGGLNFTLKEGQDVIVLGSVSVYEKDVISGICKTDNARWSRTTLSEIRRIKERVRRNGHVWHYVQTAYS